MDLPTANKTGQPVAAGLAHDSTANTPNMPPPNSGAIPDPMHAGQERDRGMARALHSTSREDRAAIAAALLRGMHPTEPRRAEDALAAAGFTWPASVTPRCLGAIVSHLARAGFIREVSWTKGRHGRSHAGRVSLWVRCAP